MMEKCEDQSGHEPTQTRDAAWEDLLDAAALRRLGGIDTAEGRELILELIQLFRDGGKDTVETLRKDTGQAAWQNVSMAAHSLKSSAGYLGATRLAELAAQLERQCTARTKDIPALTATMEQAIAAHADALIALAALSDQLAQG